MNQKSDAPADEMAAAVLKGCLDVFIYPLYVYMFVWYLDIIHVDIWFDCFE